MGDEKKRKEKKQIKTKDLGDEMKKKRKETK